MNSVQRISYIIISNISMTWCGCDCVSFVSSLVLSQSAEHRTVLYLLMTKCLVWQTLPRNWVHLMLIVIIAECVLGNEPWKNAYKRSQTTTRVVYSYTAHELASESEYFSCCRSAVQAVLCQSLRTGGCHVCFITTVQFQSSNIHVIIMMIQFIVIAVYL